MVILDTNTIPPLAQTADLAHEGISANTGAHDEQGSLFGHLASETEHAVNTGAQVEQDSLGAHLASGTEGAANTGAHAEQDSLSAHLASETKRAVGTVSVGNEQGATGDSGSIRQTVFDFFRIAEKQSCFKALDEVPEDLRGKLAGYHTKRSAYAKNEKRTDSQKAFLRYYLEAEANEKSSINEKTHECIVKGVRNRIWPDGFVLSGVSDFLLT